MTARTPCHVSSPGDSFKAGSSRARTKELTMVRPRPVLPVLAFLAGLGAGCNNEPERLQAEARLVDQGKEVFRFDTFGDEVFWTDTLRLHEVIASAVDPVTALSVGLKVDADVL